MSDVEDSPRGSPQLDRTSVISRKAKAVIAGVTALLTLATGVLTLRDQLFSGDDDPPVASENQVADVTNDAEAKSQANRLIDVLNQCRVATGRDYDGCNTGGILGASQVPIGTGAGRVALNVTSPVTFEITSRSHLLCDEDRARRGRADLQAPGSGWLRAGRNLVSSRALPAPGCGAA